MDREAKTRIVTSTIRSFLLYSSSNSAPISVANANEMKKLKEKKWGSFFFFPVFSLKKSLNFEVAKKLSVALTISMSFFSVLCFGFCLLQGRGKVIVVLPTPCTIYWKGKAKKISGEGSEKKNKVAVKRNQDGRTRKYNIQISAGLFMNNR